MYKASYQGDVVALKKLSLVGITATKRNKMMRDFATELAIMVKLESAHRQVFGVVTTDSSFLGLVLEYCEGGTLREALEADDYATAVDEAQRAALALGRGARHGVFVFQGRGASGPQDVERPPRCLTAMQGDGLRALEERVAEHGGDAVDDGRRRREGDASVHGARAAPIKYFYREDGRVRVRHDRLRGSRRRNPMVGPQSDANHDAGVHSEGPPEARWRRARGPRRVNAEVLGPRAGRAPPARPTFALRHGRGVGGEERAPRRRPTSQSPMKGSSVLIGVERSPRRNPLSRAESASASLNKSILLVAPAASRFNAQRSNLSQPMALHAPSRQLLGLRPQSSSSIDGRKKTGFHDGGSSTRARTPFEDCASPTDVLPWHEQPLLADEAYKATEAGKVGVLGGCAI